MGYTQGQIVRIELQSADLTTAAELGLFDENGKAVTLQAHERLVLRDITMNLAAAVGIVEIFSDDDDDNTPDSGELLLAVSAVTAGGADLSHRHDFGPEGVAGAIGIVPHAVAGEAGQLHIVGTAYIVNGKTPSHRPDWRENDFGQ